MTKEQQVEYDRNYYLNVTKPKRQALRALKPPRIKKTREEKLATKRAWHHANPESVKKTSRESRQKYKEQRRIDSKKWRDKNLEWVREYARTRYNKKQIEVTGRPKPELCELCNKPGRICFDHDHVTGKFRGWICHRCNVVIGLAEDNIELLNKMINYLK